MLSEIDLKNEKHISKNRDFHELQQYLESLNTSESLKNYLEQHANSKLDLLKAFLIFMTSNNSSIHTNYNYFGRTKKMTPVIGLNKEVYQ